jgi:glycine C-acetyltransferase
MKRNPFISIIEKEVARIDTLKTSKRHERIIEGFTKHSSPRAIISGREYLIFNSNDYLGLRHNNGLKKAEHEASKQFGAGPGAVRFISGTLKIHKDLEQEIAKFHKRDDAIVFSSAFAANLATMFCLSQGLTKDSLVDSDVLFVSDSLNHRSIIDGIRLTGLPKDNRAIFEHMNPNSLEKILSSYAKKVKRVVVVTDGVFSMLGEYQKLKEIKEVIEKYESKYDLGILLVVDDAHGVGISGKTGRGVEEIESINADILIGTLGKAFGSDGGYVTSSKAIINYLRESSATYIYSNSISPGTAGSALKAFRLLSDKKGKKLLESSKKNTEYFKSKMKKIGLTFAVNSTHPIQPVLIGDTSKTKDLVEYMFRMGILVTNISYPVVPPGRDEIRVQISATHTKKDIDFLVKAFSLAKKDLNL